MENNHKDDLICKLSELNSILSETNSLFKKIENFSYELKNDLLKEYQYVCSNIFACISCIHKNDMENSYTYYNQTYQAIKVLYNDCVDTIIDNAFHKLKYLAEFTSAHSIGVSEFYQEYPKTTNSLNIIRNKISESRRFNDDWKIRKEIYNSIINSDDFNSIIYFLSSYELIVNDMRIFVSNYNEQKKMSAKKDKRELIMLFATIFGATAGIISLIISFIK